MKNRQVYFILWVLIICIAIPAHSQTEKLDQIWPAHWIKASTGSEKDFGVFHFRRTVELDSIPQSLIVHTSGDNRYQLFVNGRLAVLGPARCIPDHWQYESTDIAPFLQTGQNVLAAVVWNYGAWPPDPQFSVQTAFLLAAHDRQYRDWNTGDDWRAVYNPAFRALPPDKSQIAGYFGAGATERFDADQHWWDWQTLQFDDAEWPQAVEIETAKARTCIWAGRWKLEPRRIPAEELRPQRFQAVRDAGSLDIPNRFPAQPADIRIPAHTSTRIVFDQGHETTAYPELEFSGGAGAKIRIKYVEAPYVNNTPRSRDKGHRDEITGKYFFGIYDELTGDGGSHRVYRPLWWRAFRYVEMTVETQGEPLTLHDFRSIYTGYPFKQRAAFEIDGNALAVSPERIQQMLTVGERTVRLCAHETYMDCPYYEQTQFEGDTRVQALISYYNFGDPALAKNAIEQFDWSRNEQGFLSARFPANSTYYIPNFNIFWIGMVYDYMMHIGDQPFIRSKIQGARSVLHYFLERQRPDGTIQKPDFHNFVDWSFPRGEAPFDDQGYSALVDLHVLLALQWAAELETYAGDPYFENLYRDKAEQLKTAIRSHYWQTDKNLFADTRNGDSFSIHTNAMAVITGVVSGNDARTVMQTALNTDNLVQPTVYWHFYFFQAMDNAGLGNDYLKHTTLWQQMLDAGCTTWPETGLASRSECHGWGASPNYHIYKTILGIRPAAPGFEQVLITPHPNGAEYMAGTIPHPQGDIRVEMDHDRADIQLPDSTTGTLLWRRQKYLLKSGMQQIQFER